MEDTLKLRENISARIRDAGQAVAQDLMKILERPFNEVTVNFPVKLDNGTIKEFKGYRIQHNDAMGPFHGGLRFHPNLELEDLRELSRWMTLRSALFDIPFGGAMGGVVFDPSDFSITEVERITRRFTYALGNNIGAEYDIISPDINTNQQIMAWISDTYLTMMPVTRRNDNRHSVTGKPLFLGGIEGRSYARAEGIMFIIDRFGAKSFSVQGLGETGRTLSCLLLESGLKLKAIEDQSGAYIINDDIDSTILQSCLSNRIPLGSIKEAKKISHQQFLSESVDVLISAALENQITAENAAYLKTSILIEGTQGAVTSRAEAILEKNGIVVIPDMLATAGSLLADYYEWLQNKRCERWSKDEFSSRLKKRIGQTLDNLDGWSSLRQKCYVSALQRLEKLYYERGIFP